MVRGLFGPGGERLVFIRLVKEVRVSAECVLTLTSSALIGLCPTDRHGRDQGNTLGEQPTLRRAVAAVRARPTRRSATGVNSLFTFR